MTQLLNEPTDFEWLIKGLLAQPTYGQVAGEMKIAEVATSPGSSPLAWRRWDSDLRPIRYRRALMPIVVTYVGEGGRACGPAAFVRSASAMDVKPGDLDLHPCFDVAPINSAKFQDSLWRDLAR